MPQVAASTEKTTVQRSDRVAQPGDVDVNRGLEGSKRLEALAGEATGGQVRQKYPMSPLVSPSRQNRESFE
jgi:hypothetical protein